MTTSIDALPVSSRGKAKPREQLVREELAHALTTAASNAERAAVGNNGCGPRDAARLLASGTSTDINIPWRRSSMSPAGGIDVIDLFCGCGGMSAGFRAVNGMFPAYRLAAAVDIDPVANATYEHNLGVAPYDFDAREFAGDRALLDRLMGNRRDGQPLVLIGCAPCQGFSSYRNKAGTKDSRNSLFVEFAKIAAQTQPDIVIAENVPELLTDRYWPLVDQARKVLEDAGYFVHLAPHNMAEFGVPQERFRALLLGMKSPFRPPTGRLDRENFRTVRQAIGHLTAVAAGVRDPDDPMHYSTRHKQSTLETIRAVPKDGGSRPPDVGPECLRRAASRNGRAVYEDVYGRLFWDRPAITITAYARNPASGRFVHPEQDRGLTIREAALLQSFPADYAFSGSLDDCFRQIGNAVPPAFSFHIALHVLGELSGKPLEESEFDPGLTGPVGSSFSRLIPALKAGHRDGVTETGSRSTR